MEQQVVLAITSLLQALLSRRVKPPGDALQAPAWRCAMMNVHAYVPRAIQVPHG